MNRKVAAVIICVLLCIITTAAVRLIQINNQKIGTDEKYEQLATEIKNESETEGAVLNPDNLGTNFSGLVQINDDFVGWLRVDSTKINYPVVQSKTDSEYYLNHGFYKEEDSHGVPFIDSECDTENCDNLIIYGHNMRDKTMFGELERYTDSEFFAEKHLIYLDTPNGQSVWQAVSVFRISEKDTQVFPYHKAMQFDNFSASDYLARTRYYAVNFDEEPIEDGTKLMTLSTCEYTLNHGRLVVVAKKIS